MKKKKAQKPQKTRKARRKKIVLPPIQDGIYRDIEQIYKIINKIQITREKGKFAVTQDDSIMIDNILKDLELPSKKKKIKNKQFGVCYEYTVSPGKEPEQEEIHSVEDLPDEILENGQVF